LLAVSDSIQHEGAPAAHTAHDHHQMPTSGSALTGVAISATLHCLTGCAIGEILGMFIGTAAGLSLIAWAALVLVPAWTSYSRVSERIGAAFLSLYVLLSLVGLGVVAGLGVAWFWDRIQG